MRSTGRVNFAATNWEVGKPATFVRIFATENNGADIFEHGIGGYDIEIATNPHISEYFSYGAFAGMTTGLGGSVLMRLQLDTEKHDFYVQCLGLKNVRGTTTSSQLRKRLESDEHLREAYDVSIAEMERILEARGKHYEIRGYVWEDQETIDWDENVIEIKTKFQDFEEKEALWDILGHILETTQEAVSQTYHRTIPKDTALFILNLSAME